MRGYNGVRIYQNPSTEGGTVKAAIAVLDNEIDVEQCPELTTNNIVVVRIRTKAWSLALTSFYFEPDTAIEPYIEHLKKIERVEKGKLIVGGDANAKSTWWGSTNEDHRGEQMSGGLLEMGLHILNTGDIPTFDTIRGGRRYCSHVDVTACSEEILDRVDDWRVIEGMTSSDHNGMVFTVKLVKSSGTRIERTTRLYNTRKANWDKFTTKLTQLKLERKHTIDNIVHNINNTADLEIEITKYINTIEIACKNTIPNKKKKEILTMPWWSERLAALKKEVSTRRRRIRSAALVRRDVVVGRYLEKKAEYEIAVREAITESWKEFCGKQEREGMWEGVYRVIGRVTKREEDIPLIKDGNILDAKQSVKLLAEVFYPSDEEEGDIAVHRTVRRKADNVNRPSHDEQHDPLFTLHEMERATNSFNPKKAPGEDGFTADICAKAVLTDPAYFLNLLNKCLTLAYFPKTWKKAIVIVLRKPGKESYNTPKSYRPIGLLPVMGKILEKMIVARLRFHLLPKTSPRQFGFMPQRSTEDALVTLMRHIRAKIGQKKIVTVISLDIEGAFDSAWWPAIRTRLAEEECPVNLRRVIDSYLEDRTVEVRYAGERFTTRTEKGCVQGSIGGPILWNLLLDPLLRDFESQNHYCHAFADDVVLVFDGETAMEIEGQANAALERVRAWGVANKLKFAPHKTCAMVLTKKLKFDTPRLSMGGIDVGMSSEIKILGLTIDHKLTFNQHVSNVCKKAVGIYKLLSRTARVSWGLNPDVIRTIYVAAVEPVVLYAAAAWAPAAQKLGVRRKLGSVQRGFAIKMCKAYRTVSLNSALLISGLLPLDLRVREVASLYEAKKGAIMPMCDREVERMTPAVEVPHPAEHRTITFNSLVDEEQYAASNSYDLRIFTDGSKIEGSVGAALSMWNRESEVRSLKLSLPSYCTVYQAELLALCKAVDEAHKSSVDGIGIFSDSRSALETVANPSSTHPLAVLTRKRLRDCTLQKKEVSLFWIKAHVGLEGNERADELAKDAALRSKRRHEYDLCPVSFVKRCIRQDTIDEWDRRYSTESAGSVTKLFLPDARVAFKIVRKVEIDGAVAQILTGHGGFSEYLYRFKCKESPSCICDPVQEETLLHVLTECPISGRDRFELEHEIGSKICKDNIKDIMISKFRDKFLDYCKQIVKIVANRNK